MQLARGAWRFPVTAFLLAACASLVSPPLAVVCGLFGLATLGFFRDPDRTPPSDGIVSPADGRVSVIRDEDGCLRVGVFMNVTDVHVNRAPLSGTVQDVTHIDGGYLPAFCKDSERNERVRIDFEDYSVITIAGVLVRRIHPYVEPGDAITRGDRIGHISFGSRADVILPDSYTRDDLCVERGQKVRAGETLLARE